MNAVITVVGHDTKGIISKVSTKCAEVGANIVEISQSVLKEYFAMIMVVNIDDISVPFTQIVDEFAKLGNADPVKTITEALEKINAELPSEQKVSRIIVRDSDFERTPSMKIKRYHKC